MGIMVVHGARAGGFSPISIYGSITNDIVEKSELPGSPLTLFLASFFFNLAIAIVCLLGLGVATLVFELDVGLVALTVAPGLALIPRTSRRAPCPRSAGPRSY